MPASAATLIRRRPVAPAAQLHTVTPRVQRKPGKGKGKGKGDAKGRNEPANVEEKQPVEQEGSWWSLGSIAGYIGSLVYGTQAEVKTNAERKSVADEDDTHESQSSETESAQTDQQTTVTNPSEKLVDESESSEAEVEPEVKRPATPNGNKELESRVAAVIKDANAIIVLAAEVGVDPGAVATKLKSLEAANLVQLPKQAKAPARERLRTRRWNAALDVEDEIAALRSGPLSVANEKAGKIYGNKANRAIVTAARDVAKKGDALRVDVTELAKELELHDPPTDGSVPDNHGLLASIAKLQTLTTEDKKKFDAPERCAKLVSRVEPARQAVKDADTTLDGDPSHARESDYWKHLRQYRKWVADQLKIYDDQMASTYPDWVKVEKALEPLKRWTTQLQRERTQGDAHVDDRVGTNGVAVDVTTVAALKGDGDGELGTLGSEKTALNETLKAITDAKAWKGAGKWGEYYGNGGGDLPAGSYTEYYVRPPFKADGNGLRRVVVGDDGRRWYTWTHYGEKGGPAFVLLKGYGGV